MFFGKRHASRGKTRITGLNAREGIQVKPNARKRHRRTKESKTEMDRQLASTRLSQIEQWYEELSNYQRLESVERRCGRTMPLLLLTRIAGSPVTCQIAVVSWPDDEAFMGEPSMTEVALTASFQSAIPVNTSSRRRDWNPECLIQGSSCDMEVRGNRVPRSCQIEN